MEVNYDKQKFFKKSKFNLFNGHIDGIRGGRA
jgi:hypothetical protein